MNTPLSWIKAYVPDLDVTAQEYTDAMTLSGTKVEGFERLDEDIDKIIVAKIVKMEKHPDADKLYVLKLKLDQEERQVVSGIKDFYKPEDLIGKKVVVITNLKPVKLRGVESQGMVLAAEDKDGKLSLVSTLEDIKSGASIS